MMLGCLCGVGVRGSFIVGGWCQCVFEALMCGVYRAALIWVWVGCAGIGVSTCWF